MKSAYSAADAAPQKTLYGCTRVVFRKYAQRPGVVAILLDPTGPGDQCVCYVPGWGRVVADYKTMMRATLPASAEDYASTLALLKKQIGGVIRPVTRRCK